MKTPAVVTATAAVLLTLTGCSSNTDQDSTIGPPVASEHPTEDYTPEDTPTPLVTEVDPETESSPAPDTDAFLTLARNRMPVLKYGTDQQVISLGRDVCKLYDAGWGTGRIVVNLINNPPYTTYANAGYFIGISTSAFCPEHAP